MIDIAMTYIMLRRLAQDKRSFADTLLALAGYRPETSRPEGVPDAFRRGGETNFWVVEIETFGVLNEVEQEGVTTGELPRAIDPKRIVPNY
jgi:hypothetical protein